MRDLALLMIKPDGVRQRLTDTVLAFLARRGFTALATEDVLLTPDLRARLYATTRSGGRLDWELNAVLYTLGPVTAVLLRGPSGDGGAAACLSGRLKGHFLPTRAAPGSLRGDLNAMNPIFNLVHASDDEDEVARELPVLFGRPVRDVLRDGQVAASARARPINHWRTVGDTVAALLGDGDGDLSGRRQLDTAGWPDNDTDRIAAYRAVRRAREALSAAADRRHLARTAGLPALIAGDEKNLPGLAQFSAACRALANPPDVWATYLTYTSLRYLDLCLEIPHEQ
ncbi:nucleoside-diphosphate kinase [Micromonospora sp. NPDC049175]|uniref:nucleoside-diphosphate kinase n=1 Tax=Micromonospora sp. NPDC049175 TaxID=3364266 RepID=UPI00370FC0DD